jgi:hypothetical protein
MKAMASLAICSTVLGVLPLDAPTPVLSKAITRRVPARASTSTGSQLSRLPLKCINSTNGTPPVPSSR